jgi:hypothetical protein
MTIMPGERLRTERVSGLAIVFEIVLGVVEVHAVFFQKGMHLRPGVVSKQSPQLGGRELLSPVRFQGKGFERRTGQILALCRQVSGDVLRKFKSDPHKTILRASQILETFDATVTL